MEFLMDINEAVERRNSVRQYTDKPIEGEVLDALRAEIDSINAEGDLHFQLVLDRPDAFEGPLASYGKIAGARNYVALVGKKCKNLAEKCGYFGERLVILAARLGLHSCWLALTYKKLTDSFTALPGEKFTVIIALGYGRNRGFRHKSKAPEAVSNLTPDSPEWFRRGILGALRAPTAMNQQKFRIEERGGKVRARAGIGFYTDMDLGIVKYHFELAAGKKNFEWE